MITYTLTTEGPSDRVLIRHIDWLLKQHSAVDFNGQWANPSSFASHERDVATRVAESVKNFPCNLLFVHRDADGAGLAARKAEITNAVATLGVTPPVVCLIPTRMTEAWLLVDEAAIRSAAGNPRGRVDLDIPRVAALEAVADPKAALDGALLIASETTGRKRRQLSASLSAAKHRVSLMIVDLAVLRGLRSFVEFEEDLVAQLRSNDWLA